MKRYSQTLQTDRPETETRSTNRMSPGSLQKAAAGTVKTAVKTPLHVFSHGDSYSGSHRKLQDHHKPHLAALAQVSGREIPFALPARLIQNGEEIVLSIKPGLMFVLLSGAPFIAALAIVALGIFLLDSLGIFELPLHKLAMVFLTAALLRILIGCFQWLGRTYVLTNKRIICVRGVFNISIFECPLGRVQNTILAMSISERILSLGTILFATAGTGRLEASWEMIANPIEIHEILTEYINRAQHPKSDI